MRTDELRFTAAQTINRCLAQSSVDVSLVLQAWLGLGSLWYKTTTQYLHAGQGNLVLGEVEVEARVGRCCACAPSISTPRPGPAVASEGRRWPDGRSAGSGGVVLQEGGEMFLVVHLAMAWCNQTDQNTPNVETEPIGLSGRKMGANLVKRITSNAHKPNRMQAKSSATHFCYISCRAGVLRGANEA